MSENAKKIKIYNTDKVDADLESYCDEVQNGPKKQGVSPLAVSACVLALLILGVGGYWLLRLVGVF